jgi:hypothetical protein
MSTPPTEISFKFRYVQNGYAQGFFARKGSLTAHCLFLDGDSFKYEEIKDTTTRDRRMLLVLSPDAHIAPKFSQASGGAVVLEISDLPAKTLERHIDRLSSKMAVEKRRMQLTEIGKDSLLRTADCPECQATIDLTDFEPSAYIYCRFCESLFKQRPSMIMQGDRYRTCDECGMFDRILNYNEFYFYFLLVVYGFSYKQRYLCDHCAHHLAVKMLLINLIFVLGVPVAIYNKIKSLRGRDPGLQKLSQANSLAKKGQYAKAEPIYQQIYQNQVEHPGILMNQGMGHLFGKDADGAISCFHRSLRSCSNYLPTLRLLYQMQNPQ